MVAIVSTIHKGNLNELDGILNILLDCGVDAWQIQTANVRGRMPKEWAINEKDYYSIAEFIACNRQKYKDLIGISEADCFGYYSKLNQHLKMQRWAGCQAGLQVMGIESDGAIKGCLSMRDPKFIAGKIREKSLKEIWNNPDGFWYNRRFETSMLVGICKDCDYGPICRGGCSEKGLSTYDSPHGVPFCLYSIERDGLV